MRHFFHFGTCYAAERARAARQNPPEGCRIDVTRKTVRFLDGEPYCPRCVLRELQERAQDQKQRYHELLAMWQESQRNFANTMKEGQLAELRAIEGRLEARKLHQRQHGRRYRRVELARRQKVA